jgi:hypothetical protein
VSEGSGGVRGATSKARGRFGFDRCLNNVDCCLLSSTSCFACSSYPSQSSLTFAATTRDGREGTIKWEWDSEREGKEQYEGLPRAETVLVVFPIKGEGGSRRLVEGYEEAVGGKVRWIQLGSTGIYLVRSPFALYKHRSVLIEIRRAGRTNSRRRLNRQTELNGLTLELRRYECEGDSGGRLVEYARGDGRVESVGTLGE